MSLPPFHMERWQSLHEHRVDYNLSESGVRPFTLAELRELTGFDPDGVELGYPQTNGTERLRERIAALHPGATADNVLVTSGGAEANFLALWELVSPGDRVAVLEPAYGQAAGLAAGLGARVSSWHLEEERGWRPAPGSASEAAPAGTRLLVVTNPNNPTGSILSGDDMAEVLDAAVRSGAWILADEVYAGAELSGERTPTFWGRHDRTVVTGSLSKAYGLPGLRLGWIVGPAPLIETLWARKDYTTIAPTALSDALAMAVLEPEARALVLARTRRIIRDNLTLLTAWLDARSETYAFIPPAAGAICFVRYGPEGSVPEGSAEFADRLRRERSVLVVPGAHFGMEGYLRIGFGCAREKLRAALVRLGEIVPGG